MGDGRRRRVKLPVFNIVIRNGVCEKCFTRKQIYGNGKDKAKVDFTTVVIKQRIPAGFETFMHQKQAFQAVIFVHAIVMDS